MSSIRFSMTKIASVFVMLLFTIGAFSADAKSAKAFEIVKNGEPIATIVMPVFKDEKSPEAKWNKMAAQWLQEYIKKCTGALLPLVNENTKPSGNIISVGHTQMAKKANIRVNQLKWNSCRNVVKANILFLIGRDKFGPGNKDSLGAKGTCKAVTNFLEDFLGVRWFIPSPMGVLTPKRKSLVVSGNLDKTFIPSFAYVNGRPIYARMNPASIANNIWSNIVQKTYGGHSWDQWVPASKYYKQHPEYFIEKKGKRIKPSNDHRGHLCTSNPDVKKIFIKTIRGLFDQGYELVQLAQTDGFNHCECAKCEALDEYTSVREARKKKVDFYDNLKDHPCERVHLLHKAVIDECAKSHPKKKIHMLVYGPTLWPSKKIDKYGDNVVSEVCSSEEKFLKAWKNKVGSQSVYVYFWGSYRPLGLDPQTSPEGIAERIRLYKKYGVIGIYLCGGGHNWGLSGPVYYTFSRLLGNPKLDSKKLVKEYCDFIFGKSGETMLEFYNVLYKRTKLNEDRKSPIWALVDEMGTKVKTDFTPESLYPKVYPMETVNKLETLLAKAEKEAVTKRTKGWLRFVRDFFDHLKYNAKILNIYNDILTADKYQKKDLAVLKELIKKRAELQKKLLSYKPKYTKIWYPNHIMTKRYYLKKNGKRRIKGPLNWNIDRLMETNPQSLSKASDVKEIIFSEISGQKNQWGLCSGAKKDFNIKPVEDKEKGKCYLVEGAGKYPSTGSYRIRDIQVKPGKKYRITLWLKANNISPKNIRLRFFFKAGFGKKFRYFRSNEYITSLGGWQELYVDFKAPKGAISKAMVIVQRHNSKKKVNCKMDYLINNLQISELKE